MSEAKFTPGPYLPGKTVDSIISETQVNESTDDFGELEYYGGYVIAESIAQKNKPLLMAAPDMYDALRAALCDDPDWRRLAVEAIEKAEGRIGK